MLYAVVSHYCSGLSQLQHCEGVVTLTNAERDGLARIPALLLGLFIGFPFPFLAGQHAAHLAVDVNARNLPKTQGLHEVMHGIHPQLIGQRVVVHVARLDNGFVHVHRPEAMVAVAAKSMVAKGVVGIVLNDRCARSLAGLQCGQRHEWLVSRAGWVRAAQRPIKQRLVKRFAERLPALRVDTIDK